MSFRGAGGQARFYGFVQLAPSTAEFFCAGDVQQTGTGRLLQMQIPRRALGHASEGAVAIYCPHPNQPGLAALRGRAVDAPLRVVLRRPLAGTIEALMAEIKTSTTREDLRRIRSAGFTFRVTTDPGHVREFHARHYVPLVGERFPDDGVIMPLESMLGKLDHHGELVCADLEGEWVAGVYNTAGERNYSMGALGIRDGDDGVRQKRVVSGLFVRSMQRGVELGKPTVTLGSSLPFLGKGPIWFKAKWGCALEVAPGTQMMQVLMDLRHAPVRDALARSPIVHCLDGALCASTWLPPGDGPLKVLAQEAGRYPSISRWHVLAEAATLAAARETLAANEQIVPITVAPGGAEPLWLGTLTARA